MRKLLLLSLLLLAFVRADAQQSVNLTAPIVKTSTSNCALDYFTIDVGQSRVLVVLKCNNGDVFTKVYNGTTTPTAASLISTLNISNNSAGTSLIQRIYNRLITDNVIVGTVTGTPQ